MINSKSWVFCWNSIAFWFQFRSELYILCKHFSYLALSLQHLTQVSRNRSSEASTHWMADHFDTVVWLIFASTNFLFFVAKCNFVHRRSFHNQDFSSQRQIFAKLEAAWSISPPFTQWFWEQLSACISSCEHLLNQNLCCQLVMSCLLP